MADTKHLFEMTELAEASFANLADDGGSILSSPALIHAALDDLNTLVFTRFRVTHLTQYSTRTPNGAR